MIQHNAWKSLLKEDEFFRIKNFKSHMFPDQQNAKMKFLSRKVRDGNFVELSKL